MQGGPSECGGTWAVQDVAFRLGAFSRVGGGGACFSDSACAVSLYPTDTKMRGKYLLPTPGLCPLLLPRDASCCVGQALGLLSGQGVAPPLPA